MHWPDWLEQSFFDELTAETRRDTGAWEQISARNEAFDLYVCGHAGAIRLGADRMDWTMPRPWAQPWSTNSEIVTGDGQQHDLDPLPPQQPGRQVRFRMRR